MQWSDSQEALEQEPSLSNLPSPQQTAAAAAAKAAAAAAAAGAAAPTRGSGLPARDSPGASYGGHMANWIQATTTRYKAVISHAGLMDLGSQWSTSDTMFGRETQNGGLPWAGSTVWREQSPFYQGGNHAAGTGFKSPILITIGELDFRVPLNQALQNFAVQQRLNVPSRLVVFPDENHWALKGENSRYFYREVHDWLAKHLK